MSSRKIALIAIVAVLLVGGAVAALAATGSSNKASHKDARDVAAVSPAAVPHSEVKPTIATAAGYLGLSPVTIRRDLRSGKSLAQIAQETGKSEAGLVKALLTGRHSKITEAEKKLAERVAAQVRRPGGPVARRIISLRRAALSYLGISPAQLRKDERGGRSLAQIAQSTPGRSEAGLIQALASSRRQELEEAAQKGVLSRQSERSRVAQVQKTVTMYVHRLRRALSLPNLPTP